MVWVGIDNDFTGKELSGLACALTIFAGISMVSNVLFWSGKSINLRKSVPFIVLIALVLAFALISSYPPGVLFALFLGYAASGYVVWALRWKRKHDARNAATFAAPPRTDTDTDTAASTTTQTASGAAPEAPIQTRDIDTDAETDNAGAPPRS